MVIMIKYCFATVDGSITIEHNIVAKYLLEKVFFVSFSSVPYYLTMHVCMHLRSAVPFSELLMKCIAVHVHHVGL